MIQLIKDYKKYDPAAKSIWEVVLLYPGIKALFFHRIAHFLFQFKIPFFPRFFSEVSRFLTGIEIHPGAQMGRVIIDHGMGVVIGETAIVEDGVIIYQGVSLAGTSLEPIKRHPTICKGVVIGAGAKVLGNITIGEHSRIGANSVVVESAPAGSTIVGIPGRVIKRAIKEGEELHHEKIKD
jgi:serine O-acetyltransferase